MSQPDIKEKFLDFTIRNLGRCHCRALKLLAAFGHRPTNAQSDFIVSIPSHPTDFELEDRLDIVNGILVHARANVNRV